MWSDTHLQENDCISKRQNFAPNFRAEAVGLVLSSGNAEKRLKVPLFLQPGVKSRDF